MFRRAAVDEVGGYPEWLDVEDYALWSMLLSKGHRLANIAKPLCEYRIHAESIMSKASSAAKTAKEEPRRPLAQAIYTRCAIQIGVPQTEAQRWGELWAQVRLPLPNETVDVNEIHALLKILAGHKRSKTECKDEVKQVLGSAYAQLFRLARRQGNYFACAETMVSACIHVGPLKIFSS